jgi:hypothetical protein
MRTIDGWIADIRKTPEAVKKMPDQLMKLVKAECDRSIAAGQSLDGEMWAPTVKEGKQALQGTQKLLDVYVSGRILWIRIQGALVFSQWGTGRQVRRSILPTRGMPKRLGNAIRVGIIDMGLPFMSRKGRHDRGAKGSKWQATAQAGGKA